MRRRRMLSLSLASAALSLTILAANKTAYADTTENNNSVTDIKKENGISQPYPVASQNISSVNDLESNGGAFSDQKIAIPSLAVAPQSNSVNDNVAHNVSGDWMWENSNPVPINQPVQLDLSTNACHRMGMNLSFDVDASQLTWGNSIHIAKILQSSNNSAMTVFNNENLNVPVTINNQQIGYLNLSPVFDDSLQEDTYGNRFKELDYRLLVTANHLDLAGIQHIDVKAPWLGTINYKASWSFRGVSDSVNTFHLIGDGLDKTYVFHYFWPDNLQTIPNKIENYYIAPQAGAFLSDTGKTNPGIWLTNPLLYHASDNEINRYKSSAGAQGNFDLNTRMQYGLKVWANQNNSILLPSVFNDRASVGSYEIPLYDDSGNLIRVVGHDSWNLSENTSYHFDNKNYVAQKLLAPDLTLDQMKLKNFIGISVSQQKDGSILMYFNFPVQALRLDPSLITDADTLQLVNCGDYINYKSKTKDEALVMARSQLKFWEDGPLKGTPAHAFVSLNDMIAVSDPTMHPKVYADLIDPTSGEVISQSIETGAYSSSSVKGQSQVKLFVIDQSSGRVLTQVHTFTDWPNKGKKADLTLSNITGYHLVSNLDAASSVLKRFNYTGTPLTSNVAVDYPAADTINNYYYVMEPNDEIATINFVDQDQNDQILSSMMLTGKFNQIVNANDKFNSILQGYLISGKYDLVSDALTKSPLYQDGNQTYLVVLKHHIDSIHRHYKVVENLPNNTQKAIIDVEATLYKDANVDYYSEGGAYANGKPSGGKLLKDNEFVVHAGTTAPNDTNSSWYSASVDIVPGYSFRFQNSGKKQGVTCFVLSSSQIALDIFDGSKPADDLVDGGGAIDVLPDTTFYVNFVPNEYPITVNYYDLSGNLVNSKMNKATFNSIYQLPETEVPEHYVLMSNQLKTLKVSWDVNELDLIVVPRIHYSTDIKRVNRTISIVRPDSSVQTVLQTTSFSRLKMFNEVTNEISFGNWSGSGLLLAYVPKALEGYKIDSVRSLTVLPTDEDVNTIVRYVKLSVNRVPKYIDVNGRTYDILPVGYQIVENQNPALGAVLIVKTQLPVIDIPTRVTRTVTVVMPNGRARLIKQTVKSGSVFSQVHLPRLHGYKVVISGNINKVVADNNMEATVRFVKI